MKAIKRMLMLFSLAFAASIDTVIASSYQVDLSCTGDFSLYINEDYIGNGENNFNSS